ncbi:hypothetical protein D9J65_23095 [Escherichia coli]|nr:hypothetical protein [Escherichia coli]MHT87948.1 hypothetical protein [Escherichia coli]
MTGGQLAARPARVDGGRGGDMPPHEHPEAAGRPAYRGAGAAWNDGAFCLAAFLRGRRTTPPLPTTPDRGGGGSWQGGNEQRSASRRSQTQRAGIKPFKRRPQADNLLM